MQKRVEFNLCFEEMKRTQCLFSHILGSKGRKLEEKDCPCLHQIGFKTEGSKNEAPGMSNENRQCKLHGIKVFYRT